jgi:hypothetical protein
VTAAALRRLLRHRPVRVTALLVGAWLAYQAATAWTGAAKLRAAGLAPVERRVHVELVLGFAPEPFHVAIFQDAGRLIRVDGSRVFLMDVPPEHLRDLAARYWVKAVRPWSGV